MTKRGNYDLTHELPYRKIVKTTEGEFVVYTCLGDFILPAQLKEFLGQAFDGSISISKRLHDLGLSSTSHSGRIIASLREKIKEFDDWFKTTGAFNRTTVSFIRTEGGKLFKTSLGDFILPEQWKEFLGQDVLSGKCSISERLEQLGVRAAHYLSFCRMHLNSESFNAWFENYDRRKFARDFSRKKNPTNSTSDELRERFRSQGMLILDESFAIRAKSLKIKCLIDEKHGVYSGHFNGNKLTSCPLCNANSTRLERKLYFELKQKFNVVAHFRLKSCQEIDILIDGSIGIEVNGILSHNSTRNLAAEFGPSHSFKPKPEDYHLKKTEEALAQGIKLIHIWEHRPQDIDFLYKLLDGKAYDFPSSLPDKFKLRRDYYPEAPQFEGYSVEWQPEVWHTDKNGKQCSNKDCLSTFTSGIWLYCKV